MQALGSPRTRLKLKELSYRPPESDYGFQCSPTFRAFVVPPCGLEIEYRAWTHDGKLRHASYKGLRDKQDETEVYRA